MKWRHESVTASREWPPDKLSLADSTEELFIETGKDTVRKSAKMGKDNFVKPHALLRKRFMVGKWKRCVSFADDKGMPLADVRVVDDEVVAHDLAGDSDTTAEDDCDITNYSQTPWIMAFYQPIFSKKTLKQTFAKKGLALETVDVENNRLSGTIKVHRTAICQKVFIRYTKDSWRTHCDITARELSSDHDCSLGKDEAVYYFEVTIPDDVLHVQFAVCLSDARGYTWDDNKGQNYVILHHSCLEEDGDSDSASDNTDSTVELDTGSSKVLHSESIKMLHTDRINTKL